MERIKDFFNRIIETKGFVWIASVIIIILAANNIYGYVMTDPSANQLCNTCHVMTPFIQAVNSTPHGEFNCHTCHGPPTIDVFMGALDPSITPSIIKEEMSPKINMFEECVACHELNDVLNLRIHSDHLNIVKKFSSCDVCHDPHIISEEELSCLSCHNEQEAIEEHSKFHTEALQALEQGDRDVCSTCHSPNANVGPGICDESLMGALQGLSCFDCHQAPLDNPDIRDNTCTECHNS